MGRSAKKLGDDMVRSFKRVLTLERDLQRRHAEGEWEKAMGVAVELKRTIKLSERLVRDFLEAVSLKMPPGPEGESDGNPGSPDTDGESLKGF